MQVILMAAGLGSRLGDMTEATPKALISVAGRTLVDRALEFAAQAGAARRIVVGGFCFADLKGHVDAIDSKLVVVENTRFRLGNLISLETGLTGLEPGGFLLMNTDHIYPEGVAKIVATVAASAGEVTAFCDFDRELTADDMKVELDDEKRVVSMSKKLEQWDAGYVGMTYIPANRRPDYEVAVEATRLAQGDAVHVEQILVHLANSGAKPQIADISGHGWYEVDEPHEREKAEAGLRSKEKG